MKKLLAALVLCSGILFASAPTYAQEVAVPAVIRKTLKPKSSKTTVTTTSTETTAPAPAPAAEEKKDGSIAPTIFELIHILLLILGSAIAALVVVVVKKLASKLGIELSDTQLNLVQRLAEQGIHYANQKAKMMGDGVAGPSKLKSAIDYIKAHPEFTSLAKRYSDEKLVGLIESTLNQKKSEGHPV